jgi:hypothetical protein
MASAAERSIFGQFALITVDPRDQKLFKVGNVFRGEVLTILKSRIGVETVNRRYESRSRSCLVLDYTLTAAAAIAICSTLGVAYTLTHTISLHFTPLCYKLRCEAQSRPNTLNLLVRSDP